MNLNLEPLCGWAVASSAVLGCCFIIIFVCLGAAMWCFGTILLEHYVELYRSNKRKNERKPKQPPREPDNLVCLNLHLGRRRARFICDRNIQSHPRAILPLLRISRGVDDAQVMNKRLQLPGRSRQNKLIKLLSALWIVPINKCRSFFGCNHKLDALKQPNGQKLSQVARQQPKN